MSSSDCDREKEPDRHACRRAPLLCAVVIQARSSVPLPAMPAHAGDPVKGKYFDAYVMIDIYSRYIVGAVVHAHESGPLAVEMMKEIFGIHGAIRTPGRRATTV